MSFVATPTRTFATSSLASGPHYRVKVSSGVLAIAGATDLDLGTLDARVLSTDTAAAVRLASAEGTEKVVASGAISVNAKVYTAASGKVSATQATGSFLRGMAVQAAAADGDIIEIIPLRGDTAGS